MLPARQHSVLSCPSIPLPFTSAHPSAHSAAAEYMVLPASQYSVLDAQRIERLDEDTFRCYVGGLRFLGLEVEPVITVSVTVQERGPTVRLLETKVRSAGWVAGLEDGALCACCPPRCAGGVAGWADGDGMLMYRCARAAGCSLRCNVAAACPPRAPSQTAVCAAAAVAAGPPVRGKGAARAPQITLLICLHYLSPQLRGSKAVEAANERFDATMTNVVRWQVRARCYYKLTCCCVLLAAGHD